MTTKKPLHKQIIVPMNNYNISTFIKSSGEYVANINCTLKDVKSNNFICSDYWSLIVNSNKVALPSDFLVVETCIKNLNFINAKDIQSTWLPQSKSYLEILSIPYLIKDTNTPIDTSVMETMKRHMTVVTWCEVIGLERTRWIMSRSMLTTWLPYG